jgi:hypothetical protein
MTLLGTLVLSVIPGLTVKMLEASDDTDIIGDFNLVARHG